MNKVLITPALASLLFLAACEHGQQHEMAETTAIVSGNQMPGPIHSIVVPHDEPELPPGPGREEFVAQCVICHSPRYITSQPPFSRKVWTSEVTKMIKTFGSPTTPEQALRIVDYLVSLNGVPQERKQ